MIIISDLIFVWVKRWVCAAVCQYMTKDLRLNLVNYINGYRIDIHTECKNLYKLDSCNLY